METIANVGLKDDQSFGEWRTLIMGGKKPTGAEVSEWSDLVTRVFAAELSGGDSHPQIGLAASTLPSATAACSAA